MKILLALFWLGFILSARAEQPRQNPDQLVALVQTFLQAQTATLPGQKTIHVNAPDARLTLASCDHPTAFLPTNGRLWGHTSVGVRCTTPSPWLVYLSANISIIGQYVVSSSTLSQGQLIQSSQLTVVNGELSKLPADVVLDPQQAIGKQLGTSLPAGVPLRTGWLRAPVVIVPGQAVKLISHGNSFDVVADAQAITSAESGRPVQVRAASGQIITGIAQPNGIVLVNW